MPLFACPGASAKPARVRWRFFDILFRFARCAIFHAAAMSIRSMRVISPASARLFSAATAFFAAAGSLR